MSHRDDDRQLPLPLGEATDEPECVALDVLPALPAGDDTLQMAIYRTFIADTNAERRRLGHLMAFWDAIPKYCVSRKEQDLQRAQGQAIKSVERTFTFDGQPYRMQMLPTRVHDEDGEMVERFPAEREELVEHALRRMATQADAGRYQAGSDGDTSGVVFSLSELRRELAACGRHYHHNELIESLSILRGTLYVIHGPKRRLWTPNILSALGRDGNQAEAR